MHYSSVPAKIRRTITFILVTFLLSVAILEITLRVVDPWGAWQYISDLSVLAKGYISDPYRGYVSEPGVYHLSNWTATILSDNTRSVPDTNATAPCTIVIAGDSATFSHGVNDAETWVNVLAKRHPEIHVINAGGNGYNVDSALGTINGFPHANGYLYFLNDNDALGLFHLGSDAPAITIYFFYAKQFAAPSGTYSDQVVLSSSAKPDFGNFYKTFDQIVTDPRVMIVSLGKGGDLLEDVLQRYPQQVHPMNSYGPVLSRADSHANAEGNINVANGIEPYFKQLIEQVCKVPF